MKQVRKQLNKILRFFSTFFLDDCFRFLFVADPQILGEEHEKWIGRFDSDRHLSKTFSQAVAHVQPHVVIFLGDLM